MKYLKLFPQESEYQEFITGGGGRITQCILL